jgi:hypothetical protein
MPRSKPGDASFSRRKPKLRSGPGRPGVPFRPIEGGGETVDLGPTPLFGIFRDGKRVYLPPRDLPGVPEDEANRMADNVPGAEVIPIYDPEDAA